VCGARAQQPAPVQTTTQPGLRAAISRKRTRLGRPSRCLSSHDEADSALATAVAMLREMGMAFWLPEAERELAAINQLTGA
jgi:hypothetical protein